MTQKNTPGPWHMMLTKDGYQIGTGSWEDWGSGDMAFSEFQVATVWDGMEEAMANARLVAAAPELLGALEGLRACIMETRGPDAHAACDAADAAIAKAKGETQ